MNRRYRKTIIAGNWKMNKTPSETKAFAEQFKAILPKTKWCDIVVCAPTVDLSAAVRAFKDSRIAVGAENGLTSRQLSQLTGLDTRTIQARISAERLSGVPICSDTLNGFYMPSNDEEKAHCIRSLRRRGIEILRVAEAMNRIPGDGQMELETVEAEK